MDLAQSEIMYLFLAQSESDSPFVCFSIFVCATEDGEEKGACETLFQAI